jgi:hypothetical protein
VNKSLAPDLLRRFVPLPEKGHCAAGKDSLLVLSNDARLVAAVKAIGTPTPQIQRPAWVCKLLRESEDPIRSGCELHFGNGTVVAICLESGTQLLCDYEAKEIFGFVAPSDDAEVIGSKVIGIVTGEANRGDYH